MPRNGVSHLKSKASRGIIDLNRAPDSDELFRTKDFENNPIWKPGQEPTEKEQTASRRTLYNPYHNQIQAAVERLKGPGWVVAWDNTADKLIGPTEQNEDIQMPDIILSNMGEENNAGSESEITSRDPLLLELLVQKLELELEKHHLPLEIKLNLVFQGGYIAEHYNTRRHPGIMPTDHELQSFQIEYNTRLTHDQQTLKPKPEGIRLVREVFEGTLGEAWRSYYR